MVCWLRGNSNSRLSGSEACALSLTPRMWLEWQFQLGRFCPLGDIRQSLQLLWFLHKGKVLLAPNGLGQGVLERASRRAGAEEACSRGAASPDWALVSLGPGSTPRGCGMPRTGVPSTEHGACSEATSFQCPVETANVQPCSGLIPIQSFLRETETESRH